MRRYANKQNWRHSQNLYREGVCHYLVILLDYTQLSLFIKPCGCTLKMCMGMGFPMGPGIPWESHGNGNKTELGMGMGENVKPPQWEWELLALPWEFIPKGFMLR